MSTVPLDIHTRPSDAGVFEFIEEVFFYDERVSREDVRAAREAWPNYVPLRCRRVYRSPAGTEHVVDYHVIGSYVEHPTEAYRDQNLDIKGSLDQIPEAWRHKIQGLRVLSGEWPKGSPEYVACAPEPPLKFGPWVIEQMKMARKFFDPGIRIDGDEVKQADFIVDKTMQILRAAAKRDDEDVRRANEEAAYRIRHDWKQWRKAIENERWAPEPPSPTPFVDLNLRGK